VELLLVTASEGISRDADTNAISVFGIVEDIQSPGFPLALDLNVLALIKRNEDEAEQPVQWRALLNEQLLHEGPLNAKFQGKLRTRSILRLGGLVVPAPGVLAFEIMINGQPAGRWSIPVSKLEPKPEIKTS
jgi:hypothetical protein